MMSLSIVAAKDIEQAIEILASRPRKTVKDHLAEEPEGVGNFLYDFRAAFTNYQCYYRFDPYGETCLEMDQVPAVRRLQIPSSTGCQRMGRRNQRDPAIWRVLSENPRVRRGLIRVCNTAMEHGYGLVGIGD